MRYSNAHLGRFCFFACDVDENFLRICKEHPTYNKKYVHQWLERQSHRYYLRVFVFIDSVREKGFKDPVIVWANRNLGTGQMFVHPGQNRLFLKEAMPTERLVAWVLDNTVASRHEYSDIFTNIKPIVRDLNGERLVNWIAQHRTAPNQSDQYDFALRDDTYLGAKENDTEERRKRWFQLEPFGIVEKGKTYVFGKGKPTSLYEVNSVAGVYQVALLNWFDYESPTVHYRRLK